MQEYYEFIDYLSNEQLEKAFQDDLPDTLEIIRTKFGLTDPHIGFLRRYWANAALEHWRSYRCLEWAYTRTGRPHVEGLDSKTIVECCVLHLQDCLSLSYENCDLADRNSYRKTCYENCGCPKCYHERLNKWRPI